MGVSFLPRTIPTTTDHAGSRIDFWTTFTKLNSRISFQNGHISSFYFVPNLSNLVGKVLLCRRNFPKTQFTNLISRKWFQRLLFGKDTRKNFQIHGFRFMNSDRNRFSWDQIGETITWIRNEVKSADMSVGNEIGELSFGKVVQKSIQLPASTRWGSPFRPPPWAQSLIPKVHGLGLIPQDIQRVRILTYSPRTGPPYWVSGQTSTKSCTCSLE